MGQTEASNSSEEKTKRSICHIWDRTSVKFKTLCGSEELSECITPDLAPTMDRELLCPECLRIFNEG
jgi:hypothetical protein